MYAEYKRDVSHNYLILHQEEMVDTGSYQVRMLTGNRMSCMLKCRMQGLNGKWLFYYDITSKQSIASFYEQRKMRGEDLEMILQGFICVMEEMSEFLLSAEQLVLCPEYIFLDIEKKEVHFCCLPDYHHPVQEQFRELTEYFLPRLDHEDQEAVQLGYGIYRKAMEPGLQLENIKKLLYRAGCEKEDNDESSGEDYPNEEMEAVRSQETELPDPKKKQDAVKVIQETGVQEKKAVNRKIVAGCMTGTVLLLGGIVACYLGYLPGIPVEVVMGGAIGLMAAGAGCAWAAERKKKKQQAAEWRNKIREMSAGTEPEKAPAPLMKHEKSQEVKAEAPVQIVDEEDTIERKEEYGETVILSAGHLSGTASLVSREPGELAPIYLEGELTVIGKLEQASDAVISLPTVSRVHARIRKEENEYYLADLNSRNGTYVNGRMLEADEEYLLQDEDQVDFAQARYVFLK